MEEDFNNILLDLTDKQFKNFKWHLKRLTWNEHQPIKPSELEKAERDDTVDLMVQKYESSGTVEVMKLILQKIQRNDLARSLQSPAADGRGQSQIKCSSSSVTEC